MQFQFLSKYHKGMKEGVIQSKIVHCLLKSLKKLIKLQQIENNLKNEKHVTNHSKIRITSLNSKTGDMGIPSRAVKFQME